MRNKVAFPNDLVASTIEQRKLLKYIPAEELKKSLIATIEKKGLTFAEQEFVSLITEYWDKEMVQKRHK
jgi:hypothetical protein